MKLLFLPALAAALIAPAPQFQAKFSSADNDYNPSLDASERLLVFARSKAGFKDAHIYTAKRHGTHWEDPRPIEFTDARYTDSDPWLTADGKTLYFISNRPTAQEPAKKDVDIWRSHHTAGGWSPPEHIEGVSGPGQELGPELHGDVLTFSSVRAGGRGGLDIYSARLGADGFETPKPFAGPFNSAENDSDFTVSQDGRMAAIWRGNYVQAKIYIAYRTNSGWTDPVKLPDSTDPGPFNFTPAFSTDGHSLWFASTQARDGQPAGNADIFVASLPRAPNRR